jgi:hypothetical protein
MVRCVQNGVKRDGVAGGLEAAQAAYADAGGAQNGQAANASDWNKWLIIVAAVLDALLFWHAGSAFMKFAITIFWV